MIEQLRGRAEELAKAGALGFDGPAYGFVVGLIARAERLGGDAAVRLCTRAADRLDDLAHRLERERARAARELDDLEACGVDRARAEALLARGDTGAVLRAARGRRALVDRGARPPRLTPTVPVDERSSRRRAGAAALRAARARAAKRAVTDALSARYRARRAELATAMELGSAREVMPEVAGPYNGQTVALELLEKLAELSPLYAHTLLEKMRELAPLAVLPADEPPPPRRERRAKPRARRPRAR